MLEVKNLTKQYYDREKGFFNAIKDVSFNVEKGEIVCIVGQSGSGKSTILKCLTGIENDYSGSIRINGEDSFDYLRNNRIALVSQAYSNFSWMTVYENVAVGLYGKSMSKYEIDRLVSKLLKRVGLYHVKDFFVHKLSGGMQQRVAIARAIAQDTDIVVFDEPFGALDVQTRSQMQELLVALCKEEKKTMILVTHDIEEAIYLANKVFVLGKAPGTIKKVVNTYINDKRKSEVMFQHDFVALRKHISNIICSKD